MVATECELSIFDIRYVASIEVGIIYDQMMKGRTIINTEHMCTYKIPTVVIPHIPLLPAPVYYQFVHYLTIDSYCWISRDIEYACSICTSFMANERATSWD